MSASWIPNDEVQHLCDAFQKEIDSKYPYANNKAGQQYYSKITEFAVAKLSASYCKPGEVVTMPDLKVYDYRRHSADLLILSGSATVGFIHVKAHETTSCIEESYLFKRNDPAYKNPTDSDFVAFVSYNPNTEACVLRFFGKAKNVVWGECRSSLFREKHVAAYADAQIGELKKPASLTDEEILCAIKRYMERRQKKNAAR